MSKTVLINRFDGGVSDPREVSSVMCTSVRNFICSKTKLTPYRDTETEGLSAGSITNNKPTDVVKGIIMNSTTPLAVNLYALGQVGIADTNPQFYLKTDANDVTSNFQTMTSGAGSALGTVVPNSLTIYKGHLYCLVNDGTNSKLIKHIYATSTLSVGTIGTSPTFSVSVPSKPFIHPKDNKMYTFSGYTMGVWDGTTLSTRAFGEDYNIISACPYGNNILIGMVAKDNTHSVVGVWDGSLTSSILVDVVQWGNDALVILENIGDTVIGVSTISVGGADVLGTQNAVIIRGYTGGVPQVIKKIESVGGSRVYAHKAKRNDTLYFPMQAYLNGTSVKQIWSIRKNDSGQWAVQPDRKINNDTEVSVSITGLSSVGDYVWIAYEGSFVRTDNSANYTSTSIFETLINPSMEQGDKSKKKQLKAVSVSKAHNSGNIGQLVIKYSIDGGTTWVSIGTLTSAGINTLKATNESTSTPFADAYEYMFRIESTLGAEPIEFKYSYEVIPELI